LATYTNYPSQLSKQSFAQAIEHHEKHLRDLIAQASVLGDDKTHEKRLQILL
jgi:hypothetical protein